MTTRRAFLQGTAAAAACTCAPGLAHTALARAAPSAVHIDVHHHFSPPLLREFYEHMSQSGRAKVVPPLTWDLNRDMEDMDRGGTTLALLSSFTPYDVGTAQERATL